MELDAAKFEDRQADLRHRYLYDAEFHAFLEVMIRERHQHLLDEIEVLREALAPAEPRRFEYPVAEATLALLLRSYDCEACGRHVDPAYQHACGTANVPMDMMFQCEVCNEAFSVGDVFDEPCSACQCVWEAAAGRRDSRPRWRTYRATGTLDATDVRTFLRDTAKLTQADEWLGDVSAPRAQRENGL